jgi:hypothetical protein
MGLSNDRRAPRHRSARNARALQDNEPPSAIADKDVENRSDAPDQLEDCPEDLLGAAKVRAPGDIDQRQDDGDGMQNARRAAASRAPETVERAAVAIAFKDTRVFLGALMKVRLVYRYGKDAKRSLRLRILLTYCISEFSCLPETAISGYVRVPHFCC